MPSADFSDAVGASCDEPSPPRADTPETSRGKFDRLRRTPAESTPAALDGYGLRGQAPARPATNASIRFLSIRPRLWLPASFRPRLAATPLRFARTSPPSGCAGDLHPSVVEHARHTLCSIVPTGLDDPGYPRFPSRRAGTGYGHPPLRAECGEVVYKAQGLKPGGRVPPDRYGETSVSSRSLSRREEPRASRKPWSIT